MDQSIEVDDQAMGSNNEQPANDDIPTTSSELEQHSGSEESR